MKRIGILITGSEILDGRVQDTNSHYLINALQERGFSVRYVLTCDDNLSDLKESLHYLLSKVDGIILSGGMGPTADDLTREMLSEVSGQPLELDETVLNTLKQLYVQRKRNFDPTNVKQAMFPKGATVVPNPIGTAAGFMLLLSDSTQDGLAKPIFALPGVPRELQMMLSASVIPMLSKQLLGLANEAPRNPSRSLRIFGLPESVVGQRVVASNLPSDIVVSYRAAFPEVHVILKTSRSDYSLTELEKITTATKSSLGPHYIVAEDLEESLEQVLQKLLVQRKATISVAESCTAGLLGNLLTNPPGSSAYFVGGVQTYSNQLKQQLLGVKQQSLAADGAVSFQVAAEMAAGARKSLGSDYALSITGIAGPDGGTLEKPVGTFYVGFSSAQETVAYHGFLASTRYRIRKYSAYTALDILRRHLMGIPVELDQKKFGGTL